MRIIITIVCLLLGMLLVLSLPMSPEVKTPVNIVMFLIAMWKVTIDIDALVKKYTPGSIAIRKD